MEPVCLSHKRISAFIGLFTSFYGPYDNIWSYGLLHGSVRLTNCQNKIVHVL
jgi:hypothetical protein